MKKIIIGMLLLTAGIVSYGQELYVFTEPASNMPSKSISAKYSTKLFNPPHESGVRQRHTPEIMFGLSKKWMVHGAATFSDMYSSNLRWESARIYAKYRFVSLDDVHQHFRMAVFGEASHSRNKVMYDDLGLEGDQSGVQGGLVITQLWDKLAVSSTLSYLQVLSEKPKLAGGADLYPYQAFNYTLSAGYLLLPRSYTDYRQTNVNIYAELLGQQTLDKKRYYVDLAPALQLIFNSNAKLNLGYRFQLNSDMHRMAEKSWLISFEYVFLNALKKRSS